MMRGMKGKILFSLIMLLSVIQAAPLKKAETRHFTLVYTEDTSSTAEYLHSVMEDCYSELAEFFGSDPELTLPVYIREDEKAFNAFFSPYPSNHIVIYSAHVPEDLMFGPDTMRLVFLHELTHAFTFSFRGTLGKLTTAVFGDAADLANYLHFLYFLQEGIAVYLESREGNGRLSDPFMLSHITEAVAEDIDVSYMDASGARDIKPYGELGYIYGGAFIRHASDKYGEEKIAEFFRRISSGVLSFPQNTWSDMFSLTLWDEWKAFMESVVPPDGIIRPETVASGMRNISSLSTDQSDVYYASDSEVKRLSDSKTLISLPYGAFLSSDGERHTVSYFRGEHEYTLLLDGKGREITRFDGYYMGTPLSGSDEVLLVRNEDLNSSIDIAMEDGNLLLTVPLGGAEISAVTPTGAMLLDGNVSFLNLNDGTITVYPRPEGVTIRSLSESDGVLSFSYVYTGDIWTLPRYGEFSDEEYRFSDTFFLGGVNEPVRVGDDIHFISSFFDSEAVSKAHIDELGSWSVAESSLTVFTPEGFAGAGLSSVRYVPLFSLMRGTLFPFGLGTYGDDTLAGPGLTWFTSDMSEKLRVTVSGGWDLRDRWFASMQAAYEDLYANAGASLKDGRTDFDLSLTYAPSLTFSHTTRKLTLSETVKYSTAAGGPSNVLSLTFSDLVKKDAHRYHVSGYGISVSMHGIVPALSGSLYIPSLLNLGRLDTPDFSLPTVLSMVYYPKEGIFRTDVSMHLLTAEIQKSVRFLYLYLNSFTLTGSAGVTASMAGASSYRIALEASFLLSPILGSVSSLHWKLGASLSYDGTPSFSLVFTPV